MEEEKEEAQRSSIYAIRVTVGQEKNTADVIIAHAKKQNLPILAVMAPANLSGYLFVEAYGRSSVEKARAGVKHARGMVSGELSIEELEQYLFPKPPVTRMEVGDLVEICSGPFKGERARIVQVDREKEEVTVEFFEATVPIPVTVKSEAVKVIQKKGAEGEQSP
ncbi:MAG: transcription elongation factor Spt5 [Candidatus Hadarchaeales archaeon]